MRRVSVRTLILVMELFVAVASFQYLAVIRTVRIDSFWLGGADVPAARAPGAIDDCNPAG